jgi:hypothetical protein
LLGIFIAKTPGGFFKVTRRRYKSIDILILTGIVCVLEAVNVLLLRAFVNELFTLSITVPIALIVMMRWKWPAVFPAAAGGAVYCLCNGAAPTQYLIYGLGNAAILLNLIWFKTAARKKICGSVWLSLLFTLTGFAAVIVGRTALSLTVSFDWGNILLLLSSDALNIVIGLAIIAVARKQNGLFEDQMEYLVRSQKKEAANGSE